MQPCARNPARRTLHPALEGSQNPKRDLGLRIAPLIKRSSSAHQLLIHRNSVFEKNPEYFRSVFVSGEGAEAEVQEDLYKEVELWKSKVVVDSANVKINRRAAAIGQRSGKPSQLDKPVGLLSDKPSKKARLMSR